MISQPAAKLQNVAEAIAALETNRRKHETILRNLRAYQQMKPSSRQAQSVRDHQRTLEDIGRRISQLRRVA